MLQDAIVEIRELEATEHLSYRFGCLPSLPCLASNDCPGIFWKKSEGHGYWASSAFFTLNWNGSLETIAVTSAENL